jgi:signal peptidase I
MTDLATRLRDVERVDPPDLWPDIATRDTRALPPVRPRGRAVAALVAAAVVAAGVVLPLTLLRTDRGVGPGAAGDHEVVFIEPSASMEPTIQAGDEVAVDTDAYRDSPPARGDIIAFRLPEGGDVVFFKRVIGLPGDTVAQHDGVAVVNGRDLVEPYAIPDDTNLGPWVVDPGHLFVMGDDRPNSNDSRYGLGQIPIEDVIGKVVAIGAAVTGSPSPPPGPAVATGPGAVTGPSPGAPPGTP